mmetsp:Transcript_63549/g.113078  ORF Transcript_63549/g.113078 Transcript_63549/m.113078 type:complete len:96 (+) Transcript_63549:181-468(+)
MRMRFGHQGVKTRRKGSIQPFTKLWERLCPFLGLPVVGGRVTTLAAAANVWILRLSVADFCKRTHGRTCTVLPLCGLSRLQLSLQMRQLVDPSNI